MSCFDKITRWSVVGIQGSVSMTVSESITLLWIRSEFFNMSYLSCNCSYICGTSGFYVNIELPMHHQFSIAIFLHPITTFVMLCTLVVTKCPKGINTLSVHSSTGALLSHTLEPLYLSTITIGQLPGGAPECFSVENNIKKALDARLSSLSSKLPSPFKVQKVGVPFLISINFSMITNHFYLQPKVFEAAVPPTEFQQISGDVPPLTCG